MTFEESSYKKTRIPAFVLCKSMWKHLAKAEEPCGPVVWARKSGSHETIKIPLINRQ